MNRPLIDIGELQTMLTSGAPVLLLDLRYYLGQPGRGEQEYLRGHLPGAVFVDLEQVFSGEPTADGSGGRHPLPDTERLQAGLRAAGAEPGQTIVLHDQGSSMGAARAWWVLRDVGITDTRVLDGGVAVWQAAGLPLTTEVPQVRPGSLRVGTPGQSPQVVADDVPALLADGHRLVDVRDATRFRGDAEPIDPVAGHVPGAVNLPAGRLKAEDGRFLPAAELASVLSDLGAGDAVSCGSGITASMVILAAEQAGVEGLRLYPGSWSDWISDSTRPVATGD